MKIDVQVQKQLKIIIVAFAIIAAIPPLLAVFNLLEGITVLIWSVFLLGFIAILMLLGTFWLARLKLSYIYLLTGGYWLAILLLVVFIGGIETHQTLHLNHAKDANIKSDLDNLFSNHLKLEKLREAPGSLVSFEADEQGSKVMLHSNVDISEYHLDDLFEQLIRQKDKNSASVKLIILEGDDPRMYQYSGLKVGDSIDVELNWQQRELQRSESAALMLGARDCNIRLPLTIKDQRIRIALDKDPKLTKEKLGVDIKELSEEEKQIAQELFMVAHKFEFSGTEGSLLFDNLQYDGAGALILTTSTLAGGEYLASDCDNSNNHMVELALKAKDPYLSRLLFPQLHNELSSWELEKRSAFVGVVKMFKQFPWKLQNAFSF